MSNSRSEVIQDNDVASALLLRSSELNAELTSDQADDFYDELRDSSKYRDQGFLKSLALFLDYQAKNYELANGESLTEEDGSLLNNISELYQSFETVSTLSRWNITGLIAAGTKAMNMLKEVPNSALAWISNLDGDNNSETTQELIKSIFIFAKMATAALNKDSSYKANMGRVGIDVIAVFATLDQLALLTQQTLGQVKPELDTVATSPLDELSDSDVSSQTSQESQSLGSFGIFSSGSDSNDDSEEEQQRNISKPG